MVSCLLLSLFLFQLCFALFSRLVALPLLLSLPFCSLSLPMVSLHISASTFFLSAVSLFSLSLVTTGLRGVSSSSIFPFTFFSFTLLVVSYLLDYVLCSVRLFFLSSSVSSLSFVSLPVPLNTSPFISVLAAPVSLSSPSLLISGLYIPFSLYKPSSSSLSFILSCFHPFPCSPPSLLFRLLLFLSLVLSPLFSLQLLSPQSTSSLSFVSLPSPLSFGLSTVSSPLSLPVCRHSKHLCAGAAVLHLFPHNTAASQCLPPPRYTGSTNTLVYDFFFILFRDNMDCKRVCSPHGVC